MWLLCPFFHFQFLLLFDLSLSLVIEFLVLGLKLCLSGFALSPTTTGAGREGWLVICKV